MFDLKVVFLGCCSSYESGGKWVVKMVDGDVDVDGVDGGQMTVGKSGSFGFQW